MRNRKLRNYLLDGRFQLRYTALVVVSCLAIFLVLGYLYQKEYRTTQKLAEISAGLPGGGQDEFTAGFEAELEKEMDRRSLVVAGVLLGAVAVLVVCLALISIVVTHKAAGPVFAITKFVHRIREGDLSLPRPLRKGDHFEYLYKELVLLVESLNDKDRKLKIALDEALGMLENKAGNEESGRAAQKLRELRDRL